METYNKRQRKIARLKAKREKQVKNNIFTLTIITVFIITVMSIAVMGRTQNGYSNGYYISSNQNNGLHYKWVERYTVNATYLGNNEYLDTNGNVWEYSTNETNVGTRYEIVLHDNGTKNNNTDDIICAIEKE